MSTQSSFIKSLTTTALLVALSIVFGRVFVVYLMPSLRISFGEIPIVMIGMYFGPIYGAIGGALSDLIGFTINSGGGPFFPGFTLSATLSGFIPGLFFYWFKKSNTDRNYTFYHAITIFLLIVGTVFTFLVSNVFVFLEGQVYINGVKNNLFLPLFIIALVFFTCIPLLLNKWYKTTGMYSLDKVLLTVSLTYILTSVILNTLWISMLFGNTFIYYLPLRIVTNFFTIPIHAYLLYSLTLVLRKAKLIN